MSSAAAPEQGPAGPETHLIAAYRATARLDGVGQSYLTKWLWALGLTPGQLTSPRPIVLDNRVWQTLRRLRWRPASRGSAARWVEVCSTLERWAVALNGRHHSWAVDSERLEQLLFDRKEHSLFAALA